MTPLSSTSNQVATQVVNDTDSKKNDNKTKISQQIQSILEVKNEEIPASISCKKITQIPATSETKECVNEVISSSINKSSSLTEEKNIFNSDLVKNYKKILLIEDTADKTSAAPAGNNT